MPRCAFLSLLSDCARLPDLRCENKLALQGLAHCFEKDDNGKLADRFVIEPISANSLEVRGFGAVQAVQEFHTPWSHLMLADRFTAPSF